MVHRNTCYSALCRSIFTLIPCCTINEENLGGTSWVDIIQQTLSLSTLLMSHSRTFLEHFMEPIIRLQFLDNVISFFDWYQPSILASELYVLHVRLILEFLLPGVANTNLVFILMDAYALQSNIPL
ncbi:hypothetical protein Scep_012028 [Stephania cephalantha]|uniref:Uncharacterized protein n=1 Tax=Stephania cephalantha TaxID=152367 RepID=A0AAP0JFA2_9MAGN